MLRLSSGQVESLWDEVLPVGVRELPQDLAALNVLLGDRALLAPIAAHWEREAVVAGRSSVGHGRPTIAMDTYVRLMVVKHRTGWGYETWSGRSRTRCTCGASVWSRSGSGCRRSRRSESSRVGWVAR